MKRKARTMGGLALGAVSFLATATLVQTNAAFAQAEPGPSGVCKTQNLSAVSGGAGSAPAPSPEPPAMETASLTPAPEAGLPRETAPARAETPPAWWPAQDASKLNILRAGPAEFSKAITLLTDGSFDSAESANRNIEVSNGQGAAVPAQWKVAASKKLLILGVPPGRYTVKIGAGLKDASGKAVSAASSGPVHIQ